jgi:hypothetical protein
MNWVDKLTTRTWSILVVCMLAFALSGCEGSDGAAGPAGPTGPAGPAGPEGPPGPVPDDVQAAIDNSKAESCGTCHEGVGDDHQSIYDSYVDDSALELIFTNFTSVLTARISTSGSTSVSREMVFRSRTMPRSIRSVSMSRSMTVQIAPT